MWILTEMLFNVIFLFDVIVYKFMRCVANSSGNAVGRNSVPFVKKRKYNDITCRRLKVWAIKATKVKFEKYIVLLMLCL